PVTTSGGSIASTGSGKLVLLGDVTTDMAPAPATIGGNLDLSGATRTFTVADSTSVNPDLEISAVITNGGVMKQGAGELRLSGSASNSYAGATLVSAGTLQLAKTGGALAVVGNFLIQNGT